MYIENNSEIIRSLEEISTAEAKQRLPTVVFLCILITLGIIGNVLVFFVFAFKYKQSIIRSYVLSLVAVDMLACCVSMPAEIIDNHHPYMFFSGAFCKAERFLGEVAKVGSACLITLMAIERYKTVCHPHFSRTKCHKRPWINCVIAIALALLFSWPKVLISGSQFVHFPGNITGFDCSVDNSMLDTYYPFVYTVVQLVIFVTSFITLVILYSLIVCSLCRKSSDTSFRSERMLIKSRKVTKIMFAIAVAFIVSYLPHFLLISITTARKENNIAEPSNLVLGAFPLLYRSYFINNVVNPFIYYIGDHKFRDICNEWLCLVNKCTRQASQKSKDEIAEASEIKHLNQRIMTVDT